MAEKNNDVEDLYSELEKTMSEVDSEEDISSGASDEKDGAEDGAADEGEKSETKTDEDGAEDKTSEDDDDGSQELSEEEISKLSPRAQKRIRKLAADLKVVNDKGADSEEEEKPEEKKDQEFETVEDFLAAVQDEPSRKLLETFAKTLDRVNQSKIAPIIEANAGKVFDEKFKDFESLPGMSEFKDDLRKTFVRNPGQSLEALVGKKLIDLQRSKIKPQEKRPSTPSHGGGKVDLDGLSKDELYDQLESLKE